MKEPPLNLERRVYRTVIPIDDQSHSVELTGHIVHVDSRNLREVEIWHEHSDIVQPHTVLLQVFGTGHSIPPGSRYVGTALSPDDQGLPQGRFVWHCYQVLDA